MTNRIEILILSIALVVCLLVSFTVHTEHGLIDEEASFDYLSKKKKKIFEEWVKKQNSGISGNLDQLYASSTIN